MPKRFGDQDLTEKPGDGKHTQQRQVRSSSATQSGEASSPAPTASALVNQNTMLSPVSVELNTRTVIASMA